MVGELILDFLRPLLEQRLLVDSFVLQHRWLFNIFSAIECTTFETAGKHLETVFTLVTPRLHPTFPSIVYPPPVSTSKFSASFPARKNFKPRSMEKVFGCHGYSELEWDYIKYFSRNWQMPTHLYSSRTRIFLPKLWKFEFISYISLVPRKFSDNFNAVIV